MLLFVFSSLYLFSFFLVYFTLFINLFLLHTQQNVFTFLRWKYALMESFHTPRLLDIRVTSWNVRGLKKNLIKLKQAISRIKQLKSQIIFPQETHLTKYYIKLVQNKWRGQVIYAAYNNYARGVLILIHRKIPFQIN